jgi:hypothetical protein
MDLRPLCGTLPQVSLGFGYFEMEVTKMKDPYKPLDLKTGYTSDDGDDKDFLLDPIFPTKIPNYDDA